MRLAPLPLSFDLLKNYVLRKSMTYRDFHRAKSLIITARNHAPPGNRPELEIKCQAPIPHTPPQFRRESPLSHFVSRFWDSVTSFFLGKSEPALCLKCNSRPAMWDTELCKTCYYQILDGECGDDSL
jgi:hypothetical protein